MKGWRKGNDMAGDVKKGGITQERVGKRDRRNIVMDGERVVTKPQRVVGAWEGQNYRLDWLREKELDVSREKEAPMIRIRGFR